MSQEISRFWDYDEAKANEYQSEDFAEYFRTYFTDGVPELGTNLQITADDSGMLVKAGYGYASVQGSYYRLKDDETGVKALAIAASHSSYARIDRVVLRRDKSASAASVVMAVVTGTPAASPVPPPLTREGNIYELSLARIFIGPGVLSITPEMVTDERDDNELCGLCENKVTRGRIDALVEAVNGKAPTCHNHAISNINGLIDALAGKANAVHGHEISGVSGLSDALNAKLPSASYTPADVLDKVKSLDGTGSGLDADTVDGKHASEFELVLPGERKRRIFIQPTEPEMEDDDIWLKIPVEE